jgi:hydrogenase nickel incorporation protein HypA/HybF
LSACENNLHELSIALSIIEGVEEEMARRGKPRVAAVHLRLGPLSGVVRDALLFAYDVACEGTALAGSRLEIEETPVMVYCPQCEKEQPASSLQRLHCGVCDTPSADIRQGRELQVCALELET